jgi:hypothetical protein
MVQESKLGKNEFQLVINRKEFARNDILRGERLYKVTSDPEQIRLESRSRWWIVRMWRKLWGIKKMESCWKYNVKLVEDGTRE